MPDLRPEIEEEQQHMALPPTPPLLGVAGPVGQPRSLQIQREEMPWGARPPVFPRPSLGSIENHAISVDQLASLGDLVQRLCKSRMLRYPTTDFKGRSGPVSWTEITQYEINAQIIMKLIPEDASCSCSWVELVAHQEQLAEYFCSHFWGERMREFIASITAHSKSSRSSDANYVPHYWICVYANDVRAPSAHLLLNIDCFVW